MFVQMMIAGEWLAAAFNLNSKEGITTSPPDNAAYSVAKAAVKVLTKLLEQELRAATARWVSACDPARKIDLVAG